MARMNRSVRVLALAVLLAACTDDLMRPDATVPPPSQPAFTIAMAGDPVTGMTNPTSGNASRTLTIGRPAGVVAGDLLLAQITFEKGSDAGSDAQLTPSGWTLVRRTNRSSDIGQAIFFRVATGAEPDSYDFPFNQAVKAAGGITRYTGVYTTDPIVNSSGNSGDSNTLTANSIAAEANSMLVAYFGMKKKDTNLSVPNGMTGRYQFQNPQDVTIRAADQLVGAGNTGDRQSRATTFSGSSVSDKWVAQLVALRAASRIVVVKATDPSGSQARFDFNLSNTLEGVDEVDTDFDLADDEDYDTGFSLRAGSYTIAEDVPEGWDVTAVTCEDDLENALGTVDLDEGTVSFDLIAGRTVTCTFTNTQRAELLVEKVTDPAGSEEEFDFNLSGGPDELDEDFSLQDGDDPERFLVRPGTYTLKEILDNLPEDWSLTSIVCLDGEDEEVGTEDLGNGEIELTLGAGGSVTCTFTNTEDTSGGGGPSDPESFLLYLHNHPTPPTGNTNAQSNLPLDGLAPTATTLHNYAINLDSNIGVTGRFIDKASSGEELTTTDLQKHQTWRTDALADALAIEGNVELRVWAKMKASGKRIQLRAFMLECTSTTQSSCTLFATGNMTAVSNASSTAFVEYTVNFTGVNRTVAVGNRLQLRVVMLDISDADPAYLAYDTEQYPARLILP